MSKAIATPRFAQWLENAIDSNTTMHVERRKLWENLVAITKEEHKGATFSLSLSDFLRLKQYLTARSDKVNSNDALGLNFLKLIESLVEAVNKAAPDPDNMLPNASGQVADAT